VQTSVQNVEKKVIDIIATDMVAHTVEYVIGQTLGESVTDAIIPLIQSLDILSAVAVVLLVLYFVVSYIENQTW